MIKVGVLEPSSFRSAFSTFKVDICHVIQAISMAYELQTKVRSGRPV